MSLALQRLAKDPVPIQDVVTQPLPAGLAELIMRAIEPEPADRFSGADEMATAISDVLERQV